MPGRVLADASASGAVATCITVPGQAGVSTLTPVLVDGWKGHRIENDEMAAISYQPSALSFKRGESEKKGTSLVF